MHLKMSSANEMASILSRPQCVKAARRQVIGSQVNDLDIPDYSSLTKKNIKTG